MESASAVVPAVEPSREVTARTCRRALVLAAVLVVVAFALRLPAVVQPLGVDQGIFAVAGWGLTEGLTLYRDLWDQKPPGVHLTYAIGITLLGRREAVAFWLDALAAVATCGLLFALARRLAGPGTGALTAAVYAVLMLPAARTPYGGFLERAVPEAFITPLIGAAALLIVQGERAGERSLAAPALLVGVAALYKPTAFVYWPALLVWLYSVRGVDWRSATGSMAWLFVPYALTGLWLWRVGVLDEAWIAIVEYNRAYVGIGLGPVILLDRFIRELWRLVKGEPLWLLGVVGFAAAALSGFRAKRLEPMPWLAACLFGAALVAAAANGIRFYSTYFLPAAVPLSLSAAWMLAVPGARLSVRRPVVAVALILAAAAAFRTGYHTRFWKTTTSDLAAWRMESHARLAYLERFGGYQAGRGYSARANAELTAYLLDRTSADDRIYIFGMAPAVYFTSGRLPAQRFLWTYPGVVNLVGRDAFTVKALAEDLETSAPLYLILERHNRDSLTGWRIENDFAASAIDRVLEGYDRETEIEDFVLFRRRDADVWR